MTTARQKLWRARWEAKHMGPTERLEEAAIEESLAHEWHGYEPFTNAEHDDVHNWREQNRADTTEWRNPRGNIALWRWQEKVDTRLIETVGLDMDSIFGDQLTYDAWDDGVDPIDFANDLLREHGLGYLI